MYICINIDIMYTDIYMMNMLPRSKVDDYLELVRAGFARLYFLSEQELLDVLMSTLNPETPHPALHTDS